MTEACTVPPVRTPCSIHVPLFEGEKAEADFASWPQAVQNLHMRELNRWIDRNPDLDIIEQTHSFDFAQRICVTEFHYAKAAT
jgi:hypothetical protein